MPSSAYLLTLPFESETRNTFSVGLNTTVPFLPIFGNQVSVVSSVISPVLFPLIESASML